jgi:hypothetical protein
MQPIFKKLTVEEDWMDAFTLDPNWNINIYENGLKRAYRYWILVNPPFSKKSLVIIKCV